MRRNRRRGEGASGKREDVLPVFVGTSGFSYDGWRGILYPESLPRAKWLEHYAERFRTVELNSPFYHLPKPATVEGWYERVPDDFVFAVKASRFLTHRKRLVDVDRPLVRCYEVFRLFREKLGPILFQLPPSLARDDELLDRFLRRLSREFLHVIEFRHRSWFVPPVLERLQTHGVAACSVSSPRLKTGVLFSAGGVYVRFHGEQEMFRTRYTRPHLTRWAEEIRRAVTEHGGGVPVYAYFNNDAEGHAVSNARVMAEILSGLLTGKPEKTGGKAGHKAGRKQGETPGGVSPRE